MTDLAENIRLRTAPHDLPERSSSNRRAAGPSAPGSTQRVAATTGLASRPRRRHPALGARILSAGISTTAMFGIVGALGLQNPPATAASPAPTAVESNAIVVDPRTSAPTEVVVSELSGQPIQLTATPIVRAAQPAPTQVSAAPVARTNGSR